MSTTSLLPSPFPTRKEGITAPISRRNSQPRCRPVSTAEDFLESLDQSPGLHWQSSVISPARPWLQRNSRCRSGVGLTTAFDALDEFTEGLKKEQAPTTSPLTLQAPLFKKFRKSLHEFLDRLITAAASSAPSHLRPSPRCRHGSLPCPAPKSAASAIRRLLHPRAWHVVFKHPAHPRRDVPPFIGWVLSDNAAPVRLAALKALAGVATQPTYTPQVHHFTERFKGRLLEMAAGCGSGCARRSARRARASLVRPRWEEDERDARRRMCFLTPSCAYGAWWPVGKACWVEMVDERLVSRPRRSRMTRGRARGVKALGAVLVRWETRLDEAMDEDEEEDDLENGEGKKNKRKEPSALVGRRWRTTWAGRDGGGRRSSLQHAKATAKKGEEETVTNDITRALIKGLPRLLMKHQTDQNRIANVPAIPTLMNLDLYLEMRMMTNYSNLWDDITKQFLSHSGAGRSARSHRAFQHLRERRPCRIRTTQKCSSSRTNYPVRCAMPLLGARKLRLRGFNEDEVMRLGWRGKRLRHWDDEVQFRCAGCVQAGSSGMAETLVESEAEEQNEDEDDDQEENDMGTRDSIVEILRKEGMDTDNGDVVVVVINQALREAFTLVLDGIVSDETNVVQLAKHLVPTFVRRGAGLAVLKKLDAQYIVQIQTNALSWIAKRIAGYEANGNKKSLRVAITFFRVLIPLLAVIQSRDAMKIKAHMDQVLAQAKVEVSATSKVGGAPAGNIPALVGSDVHLLAPGAKGRKTKAAKGDGQTTDEEETDLSEVEKMVEERETPPAAPRPRPRPRARRLPKKTPVNVDENENDDDDQAAPPRRNPPPLPSPALAPGPHTKAKPHPNPPPRRPRSRVNRMLSLLRQDPGVCFRTAPAPDS
ncbi:Cohesin subunit psc3 [Mycena venus]|uniref:Cohesin subunit psc3 n=1 Tax=Mycena venus TaxID=2733690 RepID=A0A8H6XN91_9AGAR|nr:Cohesin subunit psc3 [Mycena venus]